MPSTHPDGDATANPFRDKSVGVVAIIYATRGHERGGFQGCVNLPSYIYTLAGTVFKESHRGTKNKNKVRKIEKKPSMCAPHCTNEEVHY